MKYFSKSDVIFTVIIVAVAIFILFFLNSAKSGQQIEIKHNGKVIEILNLSEATTYEIKGEYTNLVEIKDGKASISHSDCPNKVCTIGSVSKPNTALVCAPNGVSVTVLGKGEIDALTQ